MAKKIRNVSPYGDLDVPLLGFVVERGATVDVTNDVADRLLEQADNWQLAGGPTGSDGPEGEVN